jgi:hypothetical protein
MKSKSKGKFFCSEIFSFAIKALFATIAVALICWWRGLSFSETMQVLTMVILVFVTWFYALETRRIRLEAGRPSLSLRPDILFAGGSFGDLLLQNGGGLARDVKVNIQTHNPSEKASSYISALDKGNVAYLNVPNLNIIQNTKGKIEVDLEYKDAYDNIHREKLTLDLGMLQQEGRELKYQWSKTEHNFDALNRNFGELTREFHNLERGLENIRAAVSSQRR